MTISEANVIAEIEGSSPFSVQTSAQATAGTNTTAKILYNSSSSTQGNFTRFLARAQSRYAADIVKNNNAPTTAEQETLLGLLIASYQEQKDPKYAIASYSLGDLSVSRRDATTAYEVAYESMITSLGSTDVSSSMSSADTDGKLRPNDDTFYPPEWRLSPLHSGAKRSTQDANLNESSYCDPL